MQNLLIEQRGPEGLLKTWRVRSEQKTMSFGHSRHAELRSPSDQVKGIQGSFQYRDEKWVYVNLDVHAQEAESMTEIDLSSPTEIRFGTTTLSVIPLSIKRTLFENFQSLEYSKPSAGKGAYQLVTVHHQARLIETQVVPLKQNFTLACDPRQTILTPVRSESWLRSRLDHFEVSQRTVYLDSAQALTFVTKDQLIDEGGRKTLYATLTGAALLALLFMLSPNSQNAEEAAIASAVPLEYREIKLSPPKKKRQTAPAEVTPSQQAQAAPAAAAAAGSAGTGGGKAASAIKALGQSRISQLIGKISASAAKSANVVVTNGIVAGSAPSGRALAAVGAITQSGKDWSGEGKAGNVKINTAGYAGGGNGSALGGIAAGKTGSGGVGLLEEDGEVVGGLDREVIAAYIRSKLGEILYCYERQLSAQPDLYGKVSVKFTIAGTGIVDTQKISETSLRSATVEGCILQKIGRWKFPTPEGGTKVVVTYPFLFKSTN